MAEPSEVKAKRKYTRKVKVPDVPNTENMTAPVTAVVVPVQYEVIAGLKAQIKDLASRIEAIENFRNPGAIEGRIQGLSDLIDSQNDKIAEIRRIITEA